MTTPHLGEDTAQALVDGALADADAAACQRHVAACGECRLLVESYRALADVLDGLGSPPPPDGFARDVMDRIDRLERSRAAERRLAGGILAGAVVLAALLVAAAGSGTWAAATAAAVTGVAGAAHAVAVAGDVASPLFRALRLQITVACLLAAVPLLLSFRRLLPRTRALAVRS